MHTAPQKEHQWLEQLVGQWTSEAECNMGPGQPTMKTKGTETVRSLGGLWYVAEGQGEMPGGAPASMILTLGYNPRTNRYVGTWIGSMMAHLWVYDGELDATGKVLTLNAEGPNCFGDGKSLAKYQDIIEIVSDGHRMLHSRMLGENGEWIPFMKAHYRRTK